MVIETDLEKVSAILKWRIPRNIHEVWMPTTLLLKIHSQLQHVHGSDYRVPKEGSFSAAKGDNEGI